MTNKTEKPNKNKNPKFATIGIWDFFIENLDFII